MGESIAASLATIAKELKTIRKIMQERQANDPGRLLAEAMRGQAAQTERLPWEKGDD